MIPDQEYVCICSNSWKESRVAQLIWKKIEIIWFGKKVYISTYLYIGGK